MKLGTSLEKWHKNGIFDTWFMEDGATACLAILRSNDIQGAVPKVKHFSSWLKNSQGLNLIESLWSKIEAMAKLGRMQYIK